MGFNHSNPYQSYKSNKSLKISFEKYNLDVGYQDHSAGEDLSDYYLSSFAIGLGAKIIEKHITLNRKKCKFDIIIIT